MGWEKRGAGTYYYRKRRIGLSVVSEYIGSGSFAELIAQFDIIERAQARKGRMEIKHLVQSDREIDRELDQIGDMVQALINSTLLGMGYHTHKGQWRKKRNVE